MVAGRDFRQFGRVSLDNVNLQVGCKFESNSCKTFFRISMFIISCEDLKVPQTPSRGSFVKVGIVVQLQLCQRHFGPV